MIRKRILIASGGTGGHIFPAIALGEELEKKYDVFYTFDERSKSYVNLDADNTFVIKISNNKGSGLIGKLKYFIQLLLALICARGILQKVKPDLVIGFGGYTTFPTLAAALSKSGATIMLHEANSVIGKANEFFLKDAKIIAGGFKDIEGIAPEFMNKFYYTGTPIRSNIEKIVRKKKSDKITLLIFGGSQAAKKFSEIIPAAILKLDKKIRNKLHIIEQVKAEDVEEIKNFYDTHTISNEIKSFFSDIDQKYVIADLVIARAGASTISELVRLKIPSILIPLPTSAKNHQYKNAKYLADKNACELIDENTLEIHTLTAKIEKVIKNISKYEENLAKLEIDSRKNLLKLIGNFLDA